VLGDEAVLRSAGEAFPLQTGSVGQSAGPQDGSPTLPR